MNKEILGEIKEICRKAIRKTEEKVLDESVIEFDKKGFISVGGAFDSVIIMVEELERQNADDN